MRVLDSFGTALREYESVSPEPSSSAVTTGPAGRLKATGLDVRGFPWIRPLAGDYAYNFKQVGELYAGNPQEPDAWVRAIARTQQKSRDRTRVAALLQAQQAERGAPPAARAAAARLADPATVAVVTGQQAGVFGGPLFTLLKAITTMKLAADVSREHRVPVVPVFWIDAEDHDWPEVSGCTVLDSELAPATVRLEDLPGAHAARMSARTCAVNSPRCSAASSASIVCSTPASSCSCAIGSSPAPSRSGSVTVRGWNSASSTVQLRTSSQS